MWLFFFLSLSLKVAFEYTLDVDYKSNISGALKHYFGLWDRIKRKIIEHLQWASSNLQICATRNGLYVAGHVQCVVVLYTYLRNSWFPCGFCILIFGGAHLPGGPFKVSAMIWFLCDNDNFCFSSFTDKVVVLGGGGGGVRGLIKFFFFFFFLKHRPTPSNPNPLG